MGLDRQLTEFVERQLQTAREMMALKEHPIFISWKTSKCERNGCEDHIIQCLAPNDMPVGMDLDSVIVHIIPDILSKGPKFIGFCVPTMKVDEEQIDAVGIEGETFAQKTLNMFKNFAEDDFSITPASKLLNNSRVILVLGCDNRGNQIEGYFHYRQAIKMGGAVDAECDKANVLKNLAHPNVQHYSAVFSFAVQHMLSNNDGK